MINYMGYALIFLIFDFCDDKYNRACQSTGGGIKQAEVVKYKRFYGLMSGKGKNGLYPRKVYK